jgi:CelD/BcsL family acetyltransferase involved in cellulose biosynthesis
MLTIREITTVSEFEDVRTEWNALARACGEISPFMNHGWFKCCLTAYGNGKSPYVLLVYRGDSLVGIAPLWRYAEPLRKITVRKLAFIASPDTGHADLIIKESCRQPALTAILRHLSHQPNIVWDLLSLTQWSSVSLNFLEFERILKEQGRRFSVRLSSKIPFIPFDMEWTAFLSSRSAKFRKTCRNIANRISRLSDVSIECIRRDPGAELLQIMMDLSKRTWKHRAGLSLAIRQQDRDFFSYLNREAGEYGTLMMWLLKINGRCVAMEYDLASDRKVHALRSDYDEEFGTSSPGAYLQYEVVKRLSEAGYDEYDTGPGASEYKLHWTDLIRTNVALDLVNSTARGWLIWALEHRAIPMARSIRDLASRTKSPPAESLSV